MWTTVCAASPRICTRRCWLRLASGLAAPQVGILRRLIWVHVPENFHDEGGPELSILLVNPEIVKANGRIWVTKAA